MKAHPFQNQSRVTWAVATSTSAERRSAAPEYPFHRIQHAISDPAVGTVEHLASHILGRMAARVSEDWQRMYGHPLYFLETFVGD